MTAYDNPTFKKNIGSQPTQSMREFPIVGDPGEQNNTRQYNDPFDIAPTADELESVRQMRQDRLNPPISVHAKERIKYLADIGKITKDIEVGGVSFTLRTLKSQELRAVYASMIDARTEVEQAFLFRRHSLAYAISKIDNQDANTMFGTADVNEKMKLMDGWEDNLSTKLLACYQELKTQSDNQFALKNEQDVKEVSEALKK